ncbi:ubiquitin-specific protease ubp2 [Mucor circinelloides]
MSTEIPALPPRKIATATQIENEAKALLDCPCYSPMALLAHLETFSSDHKHVFKSLIAESDETDQESVQDELVDTADTDRLPVRIDSNATSRYICQVCHVWLLVQHNRESAVKCPATDYLCHHYHSQSLGGYECCGCQYSLATEINEPVLSMAVVKRLEATRLKARSYADLMQNKGDLDPTLVSTYTTVLVYIRDLLNGVKRNINSVNPNFLSRIGLNDGSHALLEAIGFYFEDNYFIAPDIEAGSSAEERLKQLQQEIILSLDTLRQELGSTTVPVSTAEANIKVKTADMQQLLGIVPSLETRYTSSNDYVNRAYASFGLTSGASDTLVSWAYKKVIREPSIIMDEYDAMDSLVTIANQTNSVVLQTLIACERSQGKIGRKDIGDAYAYFGVSADAADDGLLTGLYKVKLSDEPLEKSTIQDKLKIIAIARNSTELIQFLKEEKGITSSANVQSVEDLMGVPAHMINNQQSIPVGLNNIGNTCYFNSLLQYYYTLLPFRETMINIEEYVEDENSEPKKIGGIEVDQSEIRRAKKFVGLLKELFLNLQQTNERAISPQTDLAYMALLNEKDDEDDTSTADAPRSEQQQAFGDNDVNMETVPEPISTESSMMLTDDSIGLSDIDMKVTEAQDNDVSTFSTYPPSELLTENASEKKETLMQEDIRSDSPPPAYQDIASSSEQEKPVLFDEKKETPSSPLTKAPVKLKQRPSVDTMMFGKQQDVTECMGNVMYLVEAALKPLHKTEDGEQVDDMIRQTFYGKARQILSYRDNKTLQDVKKEMEEDFSHVIVDASESKDLYDGLDEYFFAEQVENFQGGHEATREVTVKSFPPILQILVQRVQFDRATANVYKSNANIQLEKTIYLDRYADANFEALKERRAQVAEWRAELDKYKKQVAKYSKSDTCNIPIPDMLEATRQILHDFSLQETSDVQKSKFKIALNLLQKEAEKTKQLMQEGNAKIQSLKENIQKQYSDYTQLAYRLHAVFIHQGQANYGHYWIYIYDHKGDQWWKYNDSLVTKVNESEILHDTTGSTANPYFLVYVDATKMDHCVETIKPDHV